MVSYETSSSDGIVPETAGPVRVRLSLEWVSRNTDVSDNDQVVPLTHLNTGRGDLKPSAILGTLLTDLRILSRW